jgi:glutaredoxin
MLKIYTKSGCAHCIAIVHKLEELAVPFEELNISLNNNNEELIKIGGRETPHMVDLACGIISSDPTVILDHISKHPMS